MNNTGIEWSDMTFNPVTGCLHDCEYCYARRIANRFTLPRGATGEHHELHAPYTAVMIKKSGACQDRTIPYPFGFDPTFHRYRLDEPRRKKKPQNIFVCSMADLFGKWVPTSWIIDVLDACTAAPQHNYMFLTKNPQRYMELDEMALLPRERNFWYGSTTVGQNVPYFWSNCHNTFVSVEPMHGPIFAGKNITTDWVIVGAETGNRAGKVVPERKWVQDLADACAAQGIPLFMKDSLSAVWCDELIQQMPEGLRKDA